VKGGLSMDCSKVQELLSEYIDGVLDYGLSEELKKHLECCSRCKQEYELLKNIVERCHEFEDIDLPDDFNVKLHERLASEKDNNTKPEHRFIWIQKRYKIAAAFLVLAVSLGVAINSGVFSSQKKSGSAPQNASLMTQEKTTASGTGDINKGVRSTEGSGSKTNGFTAYQDAGQNNALAAKSESALYNIVINLSDDEYQKLYTDIAVEIEGMQGYLEQKEPSVYQMPRANMDTFISKLNNNYGLYDITISVADITEESSRLKSQISELDQKKSQVTAEQNSGSGSTSDLDSQIVKKMDELKNLNDSIDFITIQINRK
jgi:hypothetical protein